MQFRSTFVAIKQNLLALITFAKNFGFLADVVFPKYSQLKMHYDQKIDFRAMYFETCLLRHLTITIAHKNSILKIRYTYYANSEEVRFTNFA